MPIKSAVFSALNEIWVFNEKLHFGSLDQGVFPLILSKQVCIFSQDYKNELREELRFLKLNSVYETDQLIALAEDSVEPAWAQCVWKNVQSLKIDSIGDARKKLGKISDKWRYFGGQFNRRGSLIAGGLDLAKPPERVLVPSREQLATPVFTLVDPNQILYSDTIERPQVDGRIEFVENKSIPPSRAYLKLWEALTILGEYPNKQEKVLDLGASPGSWSWALAELGSNVLSLDRSPLDPKVSKYDNIQFSVGDAFEFEPVKMDWVFSDVICFPQKLYSYLQKWISSGYCEKFVCTLKFTGTPDFTVIDQFRRLPRSRVLHLFHNKNEVTWISHPKLN